MLRCYHKLVLQAKYILLNRNKQIFETIYIDPL